MVLDSIHHTCPHPDVNEGCHIDLNNLPKETRMTSDEIPIPVFLSAPLKALDLAILESGTGFVGEISNPYSRQPKSFLPGCKVCEVVQMLLTTGCSFSYIVEGLRSYEPIVLFEVLRELWCRLKPKPILFGDDIFKMTSSFDFLSGINERNSEKRQIVGDASDLLIFKAIATGNFTDCSRPLVMRLAAQQVFLFLRNLVQRRILEYSGMSLDATQSPTFVFAALKKAHPKLRFELQKLAIAVASAFVEFSPECMAQQVKEGESSQSALMEKRVYRVVGNVFVSNSLSMIAGDLNDDDDDGAEDCGETMVPNECRDG